MIAKADRYRTDSIVLAFEKAVRQKQKRMPISREESFIVAVEELEREVNNGGYHQFFLNDPDQAAVIVPALTAIGCPKTAAITQRAIDALGIKGDLTVEAVEAAVGGDFDRLSAALDPCDTDYYRYEEPIADRLFGWIKRNRERIQIGD